MLAKASMAKHYGIPKETFESCLDIIEAGNAQSLAAMTVLDTIFLGVMTGYNFISNRFIWVPLLLTIFSGFITIGFYAVRKKWKQHHIFFYLSVQVMMSYGVYALTFQTVSSSVLFLAVVLLLPLFHMHNMYGTTIYFLSNVVLFTGIAYSGSAFGDSMRPYVPSVIAFTLISLAIHYIYQSNRLRELINYRDSNEKQNALEISSNFEPMTRLLRRRTFIRLAGKRFQNRATQEFIAIGILDIDYFKLINDTYGHQLGDEAIGKIGQVVVETLDISLTMPETLGFHLNEEQDYGNIASRLGGDEYIFLISSEKELSGVENRIQQLLDALNGTSVGPLQSIRGSIGYSAVEGNEEKSYDELYREADKALYTAKTKGRNQAVFYTPELENQQEDDEEQEDYDGLTGLLVSKVFKERVAAFLATKPETMYAAVYFDIDNFKAYNSMYGFDKGDEFLQKVAQLLQQSYPEELISRFSDDHFVALVPVEDLEHNVGKIKYNLRKYKGDYKNTIRVGVYELNDLEENVNSICDHAKFACDTLRGRYDEQIRFFDEELHKKRDRYQYIVEHLDEAIAKEWIKVYYQPIVRTETGKICGLEALARWQDPTFGMLPPGDFIGVLEQTRLIYKLDMYMVEHVCKRYRRSMQAKLPNVPISVNLSRLDFESLDVVSEIEDYIQTYEVPRNALHIEITESALTEQEDQLKRIVGQFQQMDYQIWMDDFGSGYSSLNVLKDYQFNVIKLDMEFLKDTGKRARIILTSIVDMAKKLELQTLAEGVETEEQLEFLKSIGCDYVQGYYYSPPISWETYSKAVMNKELIVE